ncbi:MAG: hypothetical protein ACLUPK_07975 [Veillonella sp.]
MVRAALQVVGNANRALEIERLFFHVHVHKQKEYGDDGMLVFSDCGVA